MSRDNYNSILQNLKIAQADLAKIEAAPDIAKGEYLQALARLDELKRSLASLNILSARYGDDLAKTQKDANAAEDKRKADLEEINNMIDAPMFDLADYITNSEEMEILDSIEGLNKDEINRADKAAKIQAFLEENARTAQNKETKIKEEAQNLLDYFKISEKIRLDNHNPSNECHKKRGEIKNIINDYNKKTDSIKLPKTFKDLQKLAFSKKQADKDNYTKYIAVLENITKENTELNEYIKDFESYILLRQKLENPEKKLNTLIESENKVREHYNNSLKGKIISLSKLNEYKKTAPRIYDLYANVINGLISGYNFRAESREQLVSPYSAVNNTDSKSKKTEAPLPFKNLNEYNTAVQSLKDLESAVKLKDHKGTEHKYRDDIRKLIKNYNKSPENKHNELPKDFTSLLDSINEDFDKYTKYSEIIKKLIKDSDNANKQQLSEYFSKFNEYNILKHNVDLTEKTIDKLIESEVTNRKAINSKKEEQIPVLINLTSPEGYNKHLREVSEKLQKTFDDNLNSANKELKQSEFKREIYNAASSSISKLTNVVKDITVTLCLAQIKGELKTQEEKIKNLEEEINLMGRSLDASARKSADNSLDLLKNTTDKDIQAGKDSEGVALKDDTANLSVKENAQRSILAENVQRNLEIKQAELQKAKSEYEKMLNEKKLAVKEKLAVFFNEINSMDVDSSELSGKPSPQETSAIQFDIERTVNSKIDSILERAERQAYTNVKQSQEAIFEAEIKSQNAENAKHAEKADNRSSRIAMLFTEQNLTKIDTAFNIIETGINLCTKFIKPGSDDNSNEPLDINKKLDEIKAKLDDLNNPGEKVHTTDKIIEISTALCDFIENIDNDFRKKASEAEYEANLRQVISDDLNTQKAEFDKVRKATAENSTEPTFLYAMAKYILNADEISKQKLEQKISTLKQCQAETNNRKETTSAEITNAEKTLAEAKNKYDSEIAKSNSQKAEKESEIENIMSDLNSAKSSVVLESKDNTIVPLELNINEFENKKLNGLDMISRLSGIELGPEASSDEMRTALDKIYINGISASMFFNIDARLSAIKDDPTAVRDEYRDIGNTFKAFFEETLSPSTGSSINGTRKGDPLRNTLIAVENEDFLLKPVVLKRPELENAPLQTPYRTAINYNKFSIEMCNDFNTSRIEAAKADYKTTEIQEADKKTNIRRMSLNEAISLSRGENVEPLKKARTAFQKEPEKTMSSPTK